MKKLYTIIFLLGVLSINAQIVNIPDVNFKAKLIADTLINTNKDSEIQVSEAVMDTGVIWVPHDSIYDLTGIEAFTNITGLDCEDNFLTSLDLSSNPKLTWVYCRMNNLDSINVLQNQALNDLDCSFNNLSRIDVSQCSLLFVLRCHFNNLTSLDVSTNSSLQFLDCSYNLITTLNLSSNPILIGLSCDSNQLSSLNLTMNPNLTDLYCGGNNLSGILDLHNNHLIETLVCNQNSITGLDLSHCSALRYFICNDNKLMYLNVNTGNNYNMTLFSAQFNPDLTCIQVDDVAYSTSHWTYKDPNAIFSIYCEPFSVIEKAIPLDVNIYPNPSSSVLIIESRNTITMKLYNALSELIMERDSGSDRIIINMNGIPAGIYFLEIKSDKGRAVKKFAKE